MIRVLLVDDHSSFRQPLAFLLGREPDFTVVGEAGSLAEARTLLDDGTIADIAIVDLDLPDGSGTELVDELGSANPGSAVLILSGMRDRTQFARAVEAGASGVLHKSTHVRGVIEAARRLHAGEQLHPPEELVEMLRLVVQERRQNRDALRAIEQLTPREIEILQALADGLEDREIAGRMYVSAGTVRTHMVSIHKKLGLNSRLQALVFAVRHGVVEIH